MSFDQTIVNLNRWEVVFRVGKRALADGDLEEAEEQLLAALQDASKMGAGDPRVANINNSLAELYLKLEKYEEAETNFKQVITVWESTLGPSYTGLIDVLDNYAVALDKLGRGAEADETRDRAQKIRDEQAKLKATENKYDPPAR